MKPEKYQVVRPGSLHTMFGYDRDTGELTWKAKVDRRGVLDTRYEGRKVRSLDTKGYRRACITVDGRKFTFFVHAIVWALEKGEWPSMWIDHIDGDRQNNRIGNLRLATPSQNIRNTTVPYGKVRFKGVDYEGRTGRYSARIYVGGRRRRLGHYSTAEAAAEAYDAAAIKHFGAFAKTNLALGLLGDPL